jgi:large subunit ribosomal protein L35
MPKMKTHKASAKRLKVTSKGRIMHRRAGSAHLLAKKSKRRKRRMAILTEIANVDKRRLRKLIQPGGEL